MPEAARRLAVTHQSVGQWAAKVGAPVRRDGARIYVRWPDFMRWREQEMCKQAVAEATKALREQLERNDEGGDPFRRKALADAQKAEIDVAERLRTVISVDEAEAVVVQMLTDLRAQLMPFPRTAAPKLLGAKSLQELEARLDVETARLMGVLSEVSLVEREQEAA